MSNLTRRLFFWIALLTLFYAPPHWAAETEDCTASGCTYRVPLDRTGFYIAVVTLPPGQPEGVWSLLINPKQAGPLYSGSFFAGATLKENASFGSWVGFSLADTETVQIKPTDYTGANLPFTVELRLENNLPVYGPIQMTPGQAYTTSVLSPGFYVTSVLSQANAPDTFFGVDLTAPSIYGGVVGGWLDSKTGPGYAAFSVSYPQTVTFELMFDGLYGAGGAGQPQLEIYYQKADGTRELYWAAPSSSPPESATLEPIFVSQVTDPNVELGFIGTNGKETMGIFGTKDSQGRLVSVNRIAFGSQTDKNQSLSITLDRNRLPATMEFPDGSKVEYSNYTNDGANATFYRLDGSVANQAFVQLPMDALHESAEAIKEYVESSQSTVDSSIPSAYDDCVRVMTAFNKAVDILFWGVFQLASVMSCSTAATAAVATGGMAIPLALWACGSVVLNAVDKMAGDMAGDKNKSPFKVMKDYNGYLKDAVGCATGIVAGNWTSCIQSTGKYFMKSIADGLIDGSDPEKVCKQGKGLKKPDGGRAASNGDPHLYTFDKLAYDFQAVGEFILVKSMVPNDLFEVQVRQQPWGKRTDVSINQAVAMNVAGDRVGFYIGQKPMIRINGTPQDIPIGSTYSLLKGGSIINDDPVYSVIWPNGNGWFEISEGKTSSGNYLSVSPYISTTQKGQLIGLLGNADDNRENDIVAQNSTTPLGTKPSFEMLYPNYANSWRITQKESLFDYAAGEDTETFTDRTFPKTPATIPPDKRANAESICKAAGIKDPTILNDCILDVALTGEKAFAQLPDSLIYFQLDTPNFVSIGCYKDQQDGGGYATLLQGRDLSGNMWIDGNMTIEKCLAFCKGFAYAGLEVGNSCFCGNSYGKYGAATNCNYSCAGNSSQKECGGWWANSVYEVPK